jgi:hypothetical protein
MCRLGAAVLLRSACTPAAVTLYQAPASLRRGGTHSRLRSPPSPSPSDHSSRCAPPLYTSEYHRSTPSAARSTGAGSASTGCGVDVRVRAAAVRRS